MKKMPVLLLLLALSAPAAAKLPDEAELCLACHSKGGGAPVPQLRAFPRSAHKDLSCTSCHAGADTAPHTEKPQADCGVCHAEPARGLAESTHGAALKKRFGTATKACSACHGQAHGILKSGDPEAPSARVNQLATCGACHADPAKTPARVAALEPVKSYLTTVHGQAAVAGSTRAASCADCHGAHDIRHGIDSRSQVGKPNIASTCGKCHAEEVRQYRGSVHGTALAEGVKEAPTCTDCHGEHTVGKPAAVTKTCSACHASETLIGKFGLPAGQVRSFEDSYHGLAAKNGKGLLVANCASCHGAHDVLPSTDPDSRIHPSNVADTCGRCHAGAGLRLGTGKVHAALSGSGEGSAVAAFLRAFYLLMIPLTIGGMLFHNLIDLARKTLTGDRSPMREEEDPMLTGVERVQHAFLVASFVLLAWSGFDLKYPGHFWGLPFEWLGGEEFRRQAHRAAALVFLVLSLVHFGYLAWSKTGRGRLHALLPAKRDLSDPGKIIAFNLGLARKRPLLPRFSYIEKAEYWALVWGSFVMVATGAVLVFDTLSLRLLPLWVIESSRVVHFMEAVLACLAILVWHGYWVAFDPEVYPLNWSWLTGRVKLVEERHESDD